MSVLTKIFAHKAEEVARRRTEVSLDEVRQRAKAAPAPREFLEALSNASGVALIAEVKQASPSQGIIRTDFEPVAIAKAYERAGAHCVSVLTDEHYFKGSFEYLRRVRESISLPCLCKDFIADEYQVYEARAHGADAILLIVAALSDEQLRELHGLAHDLGMDVLVEVHDAVEAARALALGAPLIGVNNRDLRDFKTSLETSEALIPAIRPHALAVSESALQSQTDIERVEAAGAKAVLIGTAFCSSHDIEARVREVMGW